MESIIIKKEGYLGEGSFGTVYRARSSSGDYFAVKSSPVNLSTSLQKEQRIYANFANCPEIVRCFGHYVSVENGKAVYNLILEYASEGSLWTLMSRYPGRRLPESDVRDFTRMILQGLARIHASGFVHCDLKPDNILVFLGLDSNLKIVKNLKLADFGLAIEPNVGENGVTGEFRGTPWYMSPESVCFGKLEPKLDIWSLGCTVIEMVTGRMAYYETMDKVELERKMAIFNQLPKMPENLSPLGKDFLMKCFAIDPEKRWSADKLLSHPFVAHSWSSNFGCTNGLISENENLPVCTFRTGRVNSSRAISI